MQAASRLTEPGQFPSQVDSQIGLEIFDKPPVHSDPAKPGQPGGGDHRRAERAVRDRAVHEYRGPPHGIA